MIKQQGKIDKKGKDKKMRRILFTQIDKRGENKGQECWGGWDHSNNKVILYIVI